MNNRNGAPLVSIVTPTFNQSEYLRETVDSVLNQTYSNIEYMVIDDGSTDRTAEVLAELPQHVVTLSQSNRGQAATLNRGWDLARGKYLAYLSSDDILYPTAVAELVDFLESHPGAVCAFPDCNSIDTKSRVIKRNVCRPFDLAEVIVRQEIYIGPGAIFRRSGYEAVGGWRTDFRLSLDREFWIRLARVGTIEFLPKVLAGYRMQPRSISFSELSEKVVQHEYLDFLDRYFADTRPLPEGVAGRKQEAVGYVRLMQARNAFRGKHFHRGHELYRRACEAHPPLRSPAVKLSLLRTVVSKPIRVFIDKARTRIDRLIPAKQ